MATDPDADHTQEVLQRIASRVKLAAAAANNSIDHLPKVAIGGVITNLGDTPNTVHVGKVLGRALAAAGINATEGPGDKLTDGLLDKLLDGQSIAGRI